MSDLPPCVDKCPICGGSGNIPLGDDVDECVNLPIARRIEALETSLGPWRREAGTNTWTCIGCGHSVERGIYPTDFCHEEGCKEDRVGPVMRRAERAEAELEQACSIINASKETMTVRFITEQLRREAAEAKLTAVKRLRDSLRKDANDARAAAAKRGKFAMNTDDEIAVEFFRQSAQDADAVADELTKALQVER